VSDDDDWTARWIAPEGDRGLDRRRPVRFRRAFRIDAARTAAELRITACG
jgi:hypothetical protein